VRARGVSFLAVAFLACSGSAQAQAPRPLPPLAPAGRDALTLALASGRLTGATYALERAHSLFQLRSVRREFGDVARPGPRDATLILRDLVVHKRELSGRDRQLADAILARPDGGGPVIGDGWTVPEAAASPDCGPDVCVHWVARSRDQTPPADGNDDGIPNWVDLVFDTWGDVWAAEITTIGYREPLPDGTLGGDSRLDVYVDDLGADGVFGYCTTDDPSAEDPDTLAVWAYCVVDNDYRPRQYGSEHTRAEFLQVTSAHEFNHASQFAYDFLEDVWFMEGTAMNMEETVFPAVDDNVSFLVQWSPLTRPASPLDRGGFGDSEYGAWVFWRFLEEKIAHGDPSIIREVWGRADSIPTYSLKAARNELAQRDLAFRDVFARFGTTNRVLRYADAKKAGYPRTPTTATYQVGRKNPAVDWKSPRIDHLATKFFRFVPGRRVPRNARLHLDVRLPRHGARASVIVYRVDGSKGITHPAQGAHGMLRLGRPFGHTRVKRVDLVLSNGSTRTTGCFRDRFAPFYSCFGQPLDDDATFVLRALLRL
jgi:hypothetical protein